TAWRRQCPFSDSCLRKAETDISPEAVLLPEIPVPPEDTEFVLFSLFWTSFPRRTGFRQAGLPWCAPGRRRPLRSGRPCLSGAPGCSAVPFQKEPSGFSPQTTPLLSSRLPPVPEVPEPFSAEWFSRFRTLPQSPGFLLSPGKNLSVQVPAGPDGRPP